MLKTRVNTPAIETTALDEETVQEFSDNLYGELLRPSDAGYETTPEVSGTA